MKKLSLESNALLGQIQCIRCMDAPMLIRAFFQVRQGTNRQVAAEGFMQRWGARGKGGVADGIRTHDNRNHNPGLYH